MTDSSGASGTGRRAGVGRATFQGLKKYLPSRATGAWPSALDRRALFALVALGVGLPIALGGISGALVVPQNDDWSYRRVALHLYQTGIVELTGWEAMTLVGQIFFAQPFLWLAGGAAWAFAAASATFAIVGIAAGYYLARRVLSVPRAFFAVLTLLFLPGVLLNTTSFMTDLPAIACAALCLALGAAALDRQGAAQWPWLVASLAAGCFAFSIREFALAAPAAVLITTTASRPDRLRMYMVVGFLVIAVCSAIYFFTSHLPNRGEGSVPAFSEFLVNRAHNSLATLALTLSPSLILALSSWWRRWRLRDIAAGTIVGVFLFAGQLLQVVKGGGVPWVIIGNVLHPTGTLGDQLMAGGRPLLYPPLAWDSLNAVALIAAIAASGVLGGAIGAILGRGDPLVRPRLGAWFGSTAGLLTVFSLVYGAGIAVIALTFAMSDRYLWALAVPLSTLLLMRPGTTVPPVAPLLANTLAVAVMVGLAATSFVLLLNRDAFDAARWQMGDEAVALGIAPETVDAGFEWVGYHSIGLADLDASPTPGEPYYHWFPSFHACAVVSSSLLDNPSFRIAQTNNEAYRLLLFDGWQYPLYLYRVSGPGCP